MAEHDGERELVLGNKQLLGIFFVATLLCGVFFAMGYVVGGNSAKAGAAAAATDSASAPTSEGKREEPQGSLDNSNASASQAPSEPGDASQLPGAEPRVADNPAAAGAQPTAQPPASVAVVPVPVQPVPAPKRAAPVSTPATPQPSSIPAATGVFLSVPEAGARYLQVAAVQRPSADDLVLTLRRGGLPVILATSSKAELFEVLVGPYRSDLSLSDAKKKLTDLGYGGLVVHKQ